MKPRNSFFIIFCVTLLFAKIVFAAATIEITSPTANTIANGTVTFSVNTQAVPAGSKIDYLLNGRSIFDLGLLNTIGPLTSSPYNYNFNTRWIWDGPATLVAVIKNSSGSIVAQSTPVPFSIKNGQTTLKLISPDISKNVSGTVPIRIESHDTKSITAILYILDGQIVHTGWGCSSCIDYSHTFDLDTTSLSNGTHDLFISAVTPISNDPSQTLMTAMVEVPLVVQNTKAPLELRSTFKDVYITVGQNASLSGRMIYNDSSEQSVPTAYRSDNAGVARVDSSGLVQGVSQGIANITLTSGGKTTKTRIIVSGKNGFPHFSKDGKILYDYDSQKSLWVRSLFNLDANSVAVSGYGNAIAAAGINAVTMGIYNNPVDGGTPTSFADWKKSTDDLWNSNQNKIRPYGLHIVAIGDDIARSDNERSGTLNGKWADGTPYAEALKYAFKRATESGNTISVEMQDEIGGSSVPSDYQKVMDIVRSVNPRLPVTWQPPGNASGAAVSTWMGNPAISDYTSWYWTNVVDAWRLAYPWGGSLMQAKENMDRVVVGNLQYVQPNTPKYLLVSATGPFYTKKGSSGAYEPGVDRIQEPGVSPISLSAQIMYAQAMGMAGVRVYGFDGNDSQGWSMERRNASAGRFDLQTGLSPFGQGQDRWAALSTTFNFIKNLESYILQPQTSALDLGNFITTGAHSGPRGTIFTAINFAERSQTVRVDVSPYASGARSITRYRLIGSTLTTESISSNQINQDITFAPGESGVWVFDGAQAQPDTPQAPVEVPAPVVAPISPIPAAPIVVPTAPAPSAPQTPILSPVPLPPIETPHIVATSTNPAPRRVWQFTRNLKIRTRHADVAVLQQYLNTYGFTVAVSGAGSVGNETMTFGPATKAALIKFQKAKGITPASGYFGPLTRKYILEH